MQAQVKGPSQLPGSKGHGLSWLLASVGHTTALHCSTL